MIQHTSGLKFIESADGVIFKQNSVDKAFGKHRNDFGVYPDGSNTSVNAFIEDVKKLINSGSQKAGKYRGTSGIHIYDETSRQWVFINDDGTFNTCFKLGDSQWKYLMEGGEIN